ncbi:hypothetical protein NP493_229g00005 [Ridgeia piscesae]|uniref:Uncharacterized protein n=1 Tax=Ridgeia piscesae TaxID=27915 RepID=A0AAD9NZZ2_RIDPI|nr:hypothetical protein NP493_229g00005 [Ridgeia piscesae]
MTQEATALARENNFWRRKISEAFKIRERRPAINRDLRYNLPTTFMELLSCDNQQQNHMTTK